MLMQGGLFCGFSPVNPGNAGMRREDPWYTFSGNLKIEDVGSFSQ